MSIRINVDPANPGQFFACCGLLELADRLWQGAEGYFADGAFSLCGSSSRRSTGLRDLILAISRTTLHQIDPDDDYSSPIYLANPCGLHLDWWKDDRAGGDRLKVWAGSMRSVRIARAMQRALERPEFQSQLLLQKGTVVYDPDDPNKKVEPFYFDARRGANAQAIDIGFATDPLHLETLAYPAVEFLCLIGLQRFRPRPAGLPRLFDYCTWQRPLPISVAPSAALGLLGNTVSHHFRFENAFRTEQKKHKAFMPATQL